MKELLYDSDNTHAHAATCNRVNQRGDGSSARETAKREMENYIHADVVKELFGVDIEITDTMDVPTEISALIRKTNPAARSLARGSCGRTLSACRTATSALAST